MGGRSFLLHTVLIQYTKAKAAPVIPIGFERCEDHLEGVSCHICMYDGE